MKVILAFIWFSAAGPSDTVATVGNRAVTVSDFVERYKRFLEATGVNDNLVVRNNILQVMVYENLILQDALEKNLVSDAAYRSSVEKIKIQSILGSYYDILADSMTVTEEELKETFLRMNTKVRARHLYAATLTGAQRLRSRLLKGESFSSLAMEVFYDSRLKYSGGDLGFFSGGDMEPAFEDAAFTLPVGEISKPVRTEDGYSIIKIEQRTVRPMITETEFSAKRSRIEILVKTQKRIEMAASYARTVAAELHPVFDEKTVRTVFEIWMNAGAVDRFQTNERLAAIDGSKLVAAAGREWKVKDLRQQWYKISGRHFQRIRSADDLKELVLGLLVQEELVERSRRMNLNMMATYQRRVANDTAVELIRTWTEAVYKARLRFDENTGRFFDSDAQKQFENAVTRRYERSGSEYLHPEQRRVSEIVVDSFQTAMMMIQQLTNGASFALLAKKYSQAPSSAQEGDLGYGTRAMFGQFADTLFSARKNEILGPIQSDENFVVFSVTEVRPAQKKKLSEARPEIAEGILSERKTEAYRKEVYDILSRTKHQVHKEVLASITL